MTARKITLTLLRRIFILIFRGFSKDFSKLNNQILSKKSNNINGTRTDSMLQAKNMENLNQDKSFYLCIITINGKVSTLLILNM